MGGELNFSPADAKLDPTGFDISVSTILTQIGAEKYVEIFRKHNIGQCTLTELTEEDLAKLGVDDAEIRKKITAGVKSLPIFQELASHQFEKNSILNPIELTDILEESSQHLNRIYVSLVTNTTALKKTPKIVDSVLYRDKYASDVAICTLNEITNILNSMEIALHTKMKTKNHYIIYMISLVTNTTALKKTPKIVDSVLYRDKYASDVAICTLNEITNILNSMEIALHTKMKALNQDSHSKQNKLIVGTVGSAVVAILAVLFVKSLKELK